MRKVPDHHQHNTNDEGQASASRRSQEQQQQNARGTATACRGRHRGSAARLAGGGVWERQSAVVALIDRTGKGIKNARPPAWRLVLYRPTVSRSWTSPLYRSRRRLDEKTEKCREKRFEGEAEQIEGAVAEKGTVNDATAGWKRRRTGGRPLPSMMRETTIEEDYLCRRNASRRWCEEERKEGERSPTGRKEYGSAVHLPPDPHAPACTPALSMIIRLEGTPSFQ